MENHEINNVKVIPILLSGGSGTRLWPISRSKFPKQFVKGLVNKRSMFQETLYRLQGIEGLEDPLVVCNKDHKDLVLKQFEGSLITPNKILLESIGRNTALSIALAALHVERNKQESSIKKILLIRCRKQETAGGNVQYAKGKDDDKRSRRDPRRDCGTLGRIGFPFTRR